MKKILLIEDDVDQAFLASEALREAIKDCEVKVVGTGADALRLNLNDFDTILMDYNLPDMTGLEILHQINQRPHGPIIMLTAEEVLEIAVQSLKEGADEFVIKSVDIHQILPHIVERTIASFHQKRKVEDIEIKERERRVQIETLKRVMLTLAHHLNNALMPVTFSAELCKRSGYGQTQAEKLVKTCLNETQRVNAILERFEQYIEGEEFRYIDYLDLKDAMFDMQAINNSMAVENDHEK
ncbi:MAG: response regulator [bacterium]|nr:response regulator [bacterium]